MAKTIRMYDIDWDTSSDTGSYRKPPSSYELGLPSEWTVVVDNHWDAEEEAADLLSDNFGYCVNTCKWEEVKQ